MRGAAVRVLLLNAGSSNLKATLVEAGQDLVSYDVKHNEANGEENRDGADDNASWNCGAEGPTDDPDVEVLRSRQIRNFLSVVQPRSLAFLVAPTTGGEP
jgi:hypothetical protein